MATLPERKSTTNPRQGTLHVVKAGEGVPEYSYRIAWNDIINAVKEDHPIVVSVYATKDDFPTTNVNIGTPAVARDENRLYVYDTGGWLAASNSSSETITVENTEVYDPNKIYLGGNVFVSFVNAGSADPLFQEAAIYRSRKETVKGISPEDDLYDKDTNPEGKWEYQGKKVVLQSGGLSKLFYDNTDAIKAITDYKDGDNAVDQSTGTIYAYDSTATEGLQPNDNSEAAGRWVEDWSLASKEPKTYTIDFLTATYAAMDINMHGPGTITEITTQNIASIVVTYSGGVQQAVNPADPALSIEAGDNLYWEITRTTDGEPAAMGVKLELN